MTFENRDNGKGHKIEKTPNLVESPRKQAIPSNPAVYPNYMQFDPSSSKLGMGQHIARRACL